MEIGSETLSVSCCACWCCVVSASNMDRERSPRRPQWQFAPPVTPASWQIARPTVLQPHRLQHWMGQALTIGLVTNYLFKIHMDRRCWGGLRTTVKSHVYIYLQAQTF